MTVAVVGIWEIGWNTPIKELDLWEYPVRDFGVHRYYMTPVSGIVGPVIERARLEDVLEEEKDLARVYVDERGKEPLTTFLHPEDAIYIFGKASHSPLRSTAPRATDLSVRIPTVQDAGLLWPHQAMCLVLYDRMLKWPSR